MTIHNLKLTSELIATVICQFNIFSKECFVLLKVALFYFWSVTSFYHTGPNKSEKYETVLLTLPYSRLTSLEQSERLPPS